MMKPSLWSGICQRKSFQNFFARRKLLLAVVITATTVTSFVLPIFFAIPFTEWVPRSKLSAERCLVQTPQVQVLPVLDNVPWSCNVPHNAASNGRLLWPLSPQLPCCYQPVSMSSSRIVLPADEGRGWRLPVETVDAVENGYELVLTSCEGTKGSSLHFFPTPKIKNAEESRAISVVVLRTSGKDPLRATWSLLRKANAVNMEAYTQLHSPHNKSDVLAALTGIPEFDFPLRCLQDSSSTCPWIWRRFSAAGATTLLLEESPCVGDFATRPTDVWLRPLTELMDDALLEFDRGGDCPQATLRPRWLGLYLRTALHAVTRGAGPYWAMVYVTASDVIDAELAAVMGDVLNQAVVFLMSDKTLSVAVPQWFRKVFPDALANLSSNRRRNTTPFDVHETMVHLSDFERVNQRNGSDSADTQHKGRTSATRGVCDGVSAEPTPGQEGRPLQPSVGHPRPQRQDGGPGPTAGGRDGAGWRRGGGPHGVGRPRARLRQPQERRPRRPRPPLPLQHNQLTKFMLNLTFMPRSESHKRRMEM